jgi:hypothetical protein
MMRDLSPEKLKVVSGGQLESFSVSVDGFLLIAIQSTTLGCRARSAQRQRMPVPQSREGCCPFRNCIEKRSPARDSYAGYAHL